MKPWGSAQIFPCDPKTIYILGASKPPLVGRTDITLSFRFSATNTLWDKDHIVCNLPSFLLCTELNSSSLPGWPSEAAFHRYHVCPNTILSIAKTRKFLRCLKRFSRQLSSQSSTLFPPPSAQIVNPAHVAVDRIRNIRRICFIWMCKDPLFILMGMKAYISLDPTISGVVS